MPILRIQSNLAMNTGLPEDSVVTTFHVQTPAAQFKETEITDAWVNFQDNFNGFYPGTVATGGHLLRCYDLADPEPRAPKWSTPWAFSSSNSGECLPTEVALCISYQGARISGEDQKRRRGRMYIGPAAISQTDDGRPGASAPAALVTFFQDFVTELFAESVVFGIWSRVDSAFVVASDCWVDNAWDIQRRRGFAPTVRATGEVPL